MHEDNNDVVYDDTEIDAAAEAESFQDLPRPRYVTPVSPTIRTASTALIAAAALLAASGLLTWFTTRNGDFAPDHTNGYKFGQASVWYLSVSVGWPLLLAAALLVAVAVKTLQAREAVWLRRASIGCTTISVAAFVLVLVNRSYVPEQIPAELRRSTAALLVNRPELQEKVEKDLASLVVSTNVGIWVALLAAAACAVISAFIAVQSKRPSEPSAS